MSREIARQYDVRFSPVCESPLQHALSQPDNLGAQLQLLDSITDDPYIIASREGDEALPTSTEWSKHIEKNFRYLWLRAYLVTKRLNQIQNSQNLLSLSTSTPVVAIPDSQTETGYSTQEGDRGRHKG